MACLIEFDSNRFIVLVESMRIKTIKTIKLLLHLFMIIIDQCKLELINNRLYVV